MLNKLIGAFLLIGFIGSMAMAINFSGFQSLNGLNTTSIFVAPATGIYFINGQLTLPPQSQVVATVSKNYTTALYTGAAGATGFQVYQMVLASPDRVTVGLSSSAPQDSVTGLGINAITGQVSYGNSF